MQLNVYEKENLKKKHQYIQGMFQTFTYFIIPMRCAAFETQRNVCFNLSSKRLTSCNQL